jgi:DNA-binding response OmpR family regulator
VSTLSQILLVEDDAIVADVLRRLLMRAAYSVRIARDGAEALAQLAHQLPSVVILDLILPELSGFIVLQEMRRQHMSVPVIIITANPLYDEPLRYADIAQVLIKPFSVHELLDALRAIVGFSATA